MATKVVMAQLSPTMEEGKLVAWHVEEGDEVDQGDVVAEIETDKANMDVEALGGGVLRKRVVEEGQTVPVGALIGIIAGPDEEIEDLLEQAEAAAGDGAPEAVEEEDAEETGDRAEVEAAGAPETTGPRGREEPAGGKATVDETEAGRAARPEPEPGRERPGEGDGRRRVKASPVARKMALDRGLELGRISGSGPGGRIVKSDIEAAAARGEGRPAARAPGPERLVDESVEISQMRKAIARRLSESLGPVPHFFLTSEIDMGRALELRAELNEHAASLAGSGEEEGTGAAGEKDRKIGVNDLLLKAAAEALSHHPEINASWGEGEIRRHGSVDLGIAVALDEGLITPVLRDADRKGLRRIADEASELIRRARSRDLQPEEYQGATFSVSNLGMFPIEQFTAIINPPEAAILAVGRTVEKPVVVEGEVVVRKRMRVTMSCDHRVVDGAMGARFLETFKGMLENPLKMIL